MQWFVISILLAVPIIVLKLYLVLRNWNPMPQCHICGRDTEREWVCDRCNEFYCDNCSAPFTLHNQIDYPCCESCNQEHIHDYWDD